ncbi:MAG: DUF4145 domain-containing protein [Xanthomonadales bacterium]|nr:DUF4145 domain-containing protein [Xanthomonadales bacterium]
MTCGTTDGEDLLAELGLLVGHDPPLLEIAASPENTFSKDPNSTLVKLRQLAEHLVRSLAAQVGLTSGREMIFADLIAAVAPRIQMDTKVVRLLHHLRVKGNDAAHELSRVF